MGIFNCPDCGTSVSTKAYSCPKCARVFKEPEKEGCFLQTLNLGCMIVAIILGLIVVLFIIAGLS